MGRSDVKNSELYKDEMIQTGIRIGYFRRLADMTQEQLAERANVSASYISQIEAKGISTAISLPTLFAIADALGVKPGKLLEFDELKKH